MNEHNISLLETEIQSLLEALNEMEAGSDEYKATTEVLTKLIDRSIKEKELQQDVEFKKNNLITDSQIKREQMANESMLRREQMRKESIR